MATFDEVLILASSSPRRRELLAQAGYRFQVVAPDPQAEAAIEPTGDPALWVQQVALAKARNVEPRVTSGTIVAADTIAVCGGEIIGKPADRRDAAQILRQLSGRRHEVISGLCVWPKPGGTPRTAAEVTRLVMDRLSDSDIETYLETGLWQGKAGAFGYQDGMDWVHIESGSESNVVGLPMELLEKMLREAGSDVH